MNEMSTPTINETRSVTATFGQAARTHLGSRRGLIVMAVAALAAGAALNWSWLVAAGITPILLAVAPCAAMCALGLCMSKTMGQSCSTESSMKASSDPRSDRPISPPTSERS